jgi:hypothetical protein
MNVEKIVVDRKKARELYREYKAHSSYGEKIDREIQRAYQLIAQGRMVIKALESIRVAGLNEQGLPKLAIANATATQVHLQRWANGSAVMASKRYERRSTHRIVFQTGAFNFPPPAPNSWYSDIHAALPIIPIKHRPKEALANYHVLWEAEWRPIPPVDPMLLRRIGGDMWLVVAAWDLTEVERAAMATRLSA